MARQQRPAFQRAPGEEGRSTRKDSDVSPPGSRAVRVADPWLCAPPSPTVCPCQEQRSQLKRPRYCCQTQCGNNFVGIVGRVGIGGIWRGVLLQYMCVFFFLMIRRPPRSTLFLLSLLVL